ncbi:acetyl-CoA hydrolase/transferase C-terminal domain-containing protein [Nocardioides sp.]|uniref:acetyl-CoA hydrolase/transferase C-terminal domain-containing protein n=1 Tax=Nocardioides sp. TaxID=35761 RepID=UPI003D11776A
MTDASGSPADLLDRWVRDGSTVAIADGVGAPTELCAHLSEVAASRKGVRLILGWCPEIPRGLDLSAFSDIRSFMPGTLLRDHVMQGRVHYVPAYLSQVSALVSGPWRPDVLLLSVRETSGGPNLATEASWISAAARSAGVCIAELNNSLPDAVRLPQLDGVDLTIAVTTAAPPVQLASREPDSLDLAVAARIVPLLKPGATLQYGPGPMAEAVLSSLQSPIRIDSGIITDAVVTLAERGLVMGTPTATYLSGTDTLYEWAHERGILAPIEFTHDTSRLAAADLVALNTALQIDLLGQVALEAPGGRAAGIGGHADYAYAASRSAGGLSIIALPSSRAGRSTLVERLQLPASTPRSVVDVVVTEHGHADLRGLSDAERAHAIGSLYPEG